jgi:hypothetical protein
VPIFPGLVAVTIQVATESENMRTPESAQLSRRLPVHGILKDAGKTEKNRNPAVNFQVFEFPYQNYTFTYTIHVDIGAKKN